MDCFDFNEGWGNNNLLNFQGCGLLDSNTRAQLMALGFSIEEMNTYDTVLFQCGKVTSQMLSRFGVPYPEVQRIKYMSDIIEGRYSINTEDALIQHLKKMKLTNKKVGIYDLVNSTELNMKRKCLVAGMPAGTPFVLYNSGKENKTFNVLDVSGANLQIISDVVPKLPYGDSKKLYRVTDMRKNRIKYYRTMDEIPDAYKDDDVGYNVKCVAEILETDGTHITLKINRDYARMCGRFIIVGSLRCPDNHLGMIKIITLDGSKVYVFAKQTGWNEKEKYSTAKERIYDYGFDVNEIQGKLMQWSGQVYNKVVGVYANYEPATITFQHLEPYVDRSVRAEIDDEYSQANTDNVDVAESKASSSGSDYDDIW